MKRRSFVSVLSLLYVFALVVSALVLIHPASVSAATPFDPNDLIDDMTFENATSMSASTIDSWLNTNFPSGCIGSSVGFTTQDPGGWSSSQNKYLFGANVSAGKAIADVATNYHLSPQVILTTLQKEQSIVRGGAGCHANTPDPSTAVNSPCGSAKTPCTQACPSAYGGGCMNIAMSYGCPNYCTAKDEGFALQLTLGSWILRFSEERAYGTLTGYTGYEDGDQSFTYSGPMTAGYRQRVAGGSSVYYDGTYTTSNGTSVTIDNGATASLYTYTPFISGNQSFDNLFQSAISAGGLGFGSVYSNDTFTPHPNGTLVSYGGKVYLINNNTQQWITTAEVFASYGYSWGQVKPASTGDINLPVGATISTLAPGTIFQSGDSNVYIMTYESGSQVKQHISYQAFNNLGYNWGEVMYVPTWEVPTATSSSILTANQHPAGTVVTDKTTGNTYLLDQSSKRWILGPLAFATNNFNWSDAKTATTLDMSLPTGASVDLRQGSMLNASGNIYLVDYDSTGVLKRPVGPWMCYTNRWHYTLSDSYTISSAALPNRTGTYASC